MRKDFLVFVLKMSTEEENGTLLLDEGMIELNDITESIIIVNNGDREGSPKRSPKRPGRRRSSSSNASMVSLTKTTSTDAAEKADPKFFDFTVAKQSSLPLIASIFGLLATGWLMDIIQVQELFSTIQAI